VISPYRFLRRDLILGDKAQELDKRQLVFGVIDLAAIERCPSAVLFRFGQELECVVGRAGTSAENSHNEVRIIFDQFLHRPRPMVNDLQ